MDNKYFKLDFKVYPKFINHCYIADWEHCKVYPRLWYNKTKNTPGFKHHSIAIRWLWWYFGFQKIYKDEEDTNS